MRISCSLVLVSALFATGSCTEFSPQSPAQNARAQGIYQYLMDQVPKYGEHSDAKAMAACITWKNSERKQDKIVGIRWFIIGRTSDGNFSGNQLMTSAMASCERDIEGQEGCTCHPLALNNENVLRVPE